jgi:enoyl-CoA hydratase/carnithine racemase
MKGVREVTLNNPCKRNVLSKEMVASLHESLNDDEGLRVVVLKAKGKVFSAGHDLKELLSPDREQVLLSTSHLMLRLRDLSVPVVVQVCGPVVAAGLQLMASCDIVIASHCSTFSTPGANVGVFCSTPGVALVRNTPIKTAAYMLFTGMSISADEALRVGLISLSAAKEDLDTVTEEVLDSICSKSKSVVSLGKKFFYDQESMRDLGEAYAKGCQVMSKNLEHSDAHEGIRAFSSKTKPQWTHESWKD